MNDQQVLNRTELRGHISQVKEVATKTGTKMASFKILVGEDLFRCVCWKDNADFILTQPSGTVHVVGRIQKSNWESGNTKFLTYQIAVDAIVPAGGGEQHEEAKQEGCPNDQQTVTT